MTRFSFALSWGFICPIVFLSEMALAEVTFGDFTASRNSDSIEGQGIDLYYRSRLFDVTYPYEDEPARGLAFGLDLTQQSVTESDNDLAKLYGISGTFDYKWTNNHQIGASLGINSIVSEITDQSHEQLTYQARYRGIINDFSVIADVHRRNLLQDLAIKGSAPIDLNANVASVRMQHYFLQKWVRAVAHYQQKWVSDGNRGSISDASIYIGRVWPTWIWLGYGYSKVSFAREESFYWTPEKFESHGPRLDLSYSISSQWSVFIGYNYNFNKENKEFTAEGEGYYFAGGILYGNRNHHYLKLTAIKIKSMQERNEWNQSDFRATLNWSF